MIKIMIEYIKSVFWPRYSCGICNNKMKKEEKCEFILKCSDGDYPVNVCHECFDVMNNTHKIVDDYRRKKRIDF